MADSGASAIASILVERHPFEVQLFAPRSKRAKFVMAIVQATWRERRRRDVDATGCRLIVRKVARSKPQFVPRFRDLFSSHICRPAESVCANA
jgi:hypothetical protein